MEKDITYIIDLMNRLQHEIICFLYYLIASTKCPLNKLVHLDNQENILSY